MFESIREFVRDWWRVDPAGLVALVGYSLAVMFAAVAVALVIKAATA